MASGGRRGTDARAAGSRTRRWQRRAAGTCAGTRGPGTERTGAQRAALALSADAGPAPHRRGSRRHHVRARDASGARLQRQTAMSILGTR